MERKIILFAGIRFFPPCGSLLKEKEVKSDAKGMNVYNAQQSDVMSDLALANVEALASGSEGGGLPWKGYYSNWDKGCCSPGKWNDECSGSFSPC